MHGNLPVSFSDFFPTNPDTNSRRANHIPRNVARHRTTFSAKLPFHNFPLIWNSINSNTLSITNRNQFKQRVKSSMVNMYELHVVCDNPRCPDCNPS